jgi:uncharacterized protein
MPKTAPSGVPPDERIAPIDILRGIALFGVMAVNVVNEFRVSMFQQFVPGFETLSFPDRVAGVFIAQVLELKAFALFSLLFGIGLGIQFERLSRGGQPFYFLGRRLVVLLAFGLIHLLCIWNGDILTEYALAGLIVLPFLRGPKWLVGWLAFGVLYFYVVMPLMGLKIWWPDTATFQRAVDEANRVYATGGFGDIWTISLDELPLWLPLHEYIFPRTVGLFFLGAFAWRSGMFKDLGRFKSQLAIGAVVGIGVGGALTTMQGAGGRIATVVLALGYASAVLALTQLPRVGRALMVFAPLGKMAFTNYIMQSLVFSAIFFGWGLGLYGKLGPAMALLIGVAVYVGQMFFSAWWLGRFRYGPLEWLWRTLMYGRMQTLGV